MRSVKCDPEEAEKLLKIAASYAQMDEYTTIVRPWIFGDYARKPSINLHTQFALYKCMHGKCIFSTDSKELWVDHMQVHIKMIDSFTVKHHRFTKADRNEQKKFRECCYCVRESKTNHEVIRHMEEEHRRCIFQCAHCFYRCIEMDCILIHYETYHPNQSKEILLCGDKRDFEQKDEELLEESYQYVKKIKCGQGKNEVLYFECNEFF